MIKINLAPEEEIESKLWWLPLVLGIVAIYLITSYAVTLYHDDIKAEMASVKDESNEYQRGFRELSGKQKEFQERDAERKDLNNRLASLQRITESKILRYRPVILLEHLQNLKPEGIWFSSVSLLKSKANARARTDVVTPTGEAAADVLAKNEQEADQHEIKVIGRAFDNILVAEFLSALRSTQMQDVDPTSLRTMVYFTDITLNQSVSTTEVLATPQTPNDEQGALAINALGQTQEPQAQQSGESVAEFEITLKFREHPSPVKNPAMQTFSFRPSKNKHFTMY